MNFEEWYFELKAEGKLDREIASLIGVCESTLKRIKNIHGVELTTRTRKNHQGLSEQELRIAVENGISRRLALRRVREYKWSNHDAIHTPKGLWCGNRRRNKEEIKQADKEYHQRYYQNVKEKLRKERMVKL